MADPASGRTGAGAAIRRSDGGATVRLHVAPGARRSRIEGIVAEADGAAALKISVTAAPGAGKANTAVIAFLARTWRIPKSSFRVLHGAAARRKVLFVEGAPAEIAAAIEGHGAMDGQ